LYPWLKRKDWTKQSPTFGILAGKKNTFVSWDVGKWGRAHGILLVALSDDRVASSSVK
jgi:hypothetical protein